jgi:hypothetical protein
MLGAETMTLCSSSGAATRQPFSSLIEEAPSRSRLRETQYRSAAMPTFRSGRIERFASFVEKVAGQHVSSTSGLRAAVSCSLPEEVPQGDSHPGQNEFVVDRDTWEGVKKVVTGRRYGKQFCELCVMFLGKEL